MIFRCTGGLQFKRETHPFLQNTYHWASNRRTQGFHSCLLYLIQNSLIHISLTYVSAPLFQVTYQSKLLTTAILPNILLWSRTYNTRQWLGIITLAIGDWSSHCGYAWRGRWKRTQRITYLLRQIYFFGLVLVAVSCLCSSFAGVYFEKVVKVQNETSKASVWMQNIQLS